MTVSETKETRDGVYSTLGTVIPPTPLHIKVLRKVLPLLTAGNSSLAPDRTAADPSFRYGTQIVQARFGGLQ